MKNNLIIIGVTNIITDEAGEILLMKRPSDDYAFPGFWGLVGGLVQNNETLKEALQRETMEEIGVQIRDIKFTGHYYDTPGRCPTRTAISLAFRSRIVEGWPKPSQPSECVDVKWFTPVEVSHMKLAFDHKQMLEDEGLI